jgi:hypothetical protein
VQSGPARSPLVHGELLAQGEVLEGDRAVTAAEEREEAQQVEQQAAFEEVVQQVRMFNGTADKYVGDGFEAVCTARWA